MPYKISWEGEGMLIKWTGQFTSTDNIRANGEMYGNKNFDTIKYQICDFLNVKFENITDREVNTVAALEMQATIWNKNLKVVHVTKDVEVVNAIKFYEKQMENSDWEFKICNNLEDARKWVQSFE